VSSTTGGLLAVHAHPDDETLSTGALLAAWAASGRPVTVVTCTRGEQGKVIPADLAHLAADPAALAAHREGELAEALAALGVTDHVFLDRVGEAGARFLDSGMVWTAPGQAGVGDDLPPGAFARVAVDDAALRLAELIRARRPDVVVGYEPGGGYGHPDHVHAHRVMRAAVELAAASGAASYRVPVVLWAVVDAQALLRARAEPVRTRLSRPNGAPSGAGLPPDASDGPLPSAAVPQEAVDVRVDVPPFLGRVASALAAYRTQVQGVAIWDTGAASVGSFTIGNGVPQPIPRAECYRCDPSWRPGPVVWPEHVRPGIA
jgi:N-acetyl-1-D-myo-inositol-2-amino-2-deoxy-alpha-D-glucopyranoside deacetylase